MTSSTLVADAPTRDHPSAPRPTSTAQRSAPAAAIRAARPAESPTGTRPARNKALDALRGLAALVVVLHHLTLLSPAVQSDTYPGWLDRIVHSPAQVLIDGPAAVWVFFVLSGVVVMMPVAGWSRRQWATYLPRRLVRLYLPAVASVPIALTLWWLTFHDGFDGESGWAAGHHSYDLALTLRKSFTILGGTTMLNSPLWSLRWELIFSITFPLLAVLVLALRRAWPLVLVACGCLTWWAMGVTDGSSWVDAARYLPLFVIGMVLAERMPHWREPLTTVPRGVWGGLGVAAVIGLTLPATAGHGLPALDNPAGPATVAAAVIVFVVAHAPEARWLTRRESVQWLASRSFSLYLVHEPIVLACSGILRSANPIVVGFFALPLALAGADLFCRVIEAPTHRLARRIR